MIGDLKRCQDTFLTFKTKGKVAEWSNNFIFV